MLNVGWGEMGLIMLIALVVFGPNRLPEIARSMGKFMRNFQRETSRAMADLKEGLEPINIGIFDEPDKVAADPVVAGAVEPVTGAPPTKPLATTRRKTSTSPKRRATTASTRARSTAASKKTTAKRPAAKRPARRTTAMKPRRRS